MTTKNNKNKQGKTAQKKAAPAVEKQAERNIVAALDIGSSKICCFIAEIGRHGGIEVIGIGQQASRGVKAGSIIDLKAAETAVAHAVEDAEMMAKDRLQGAPIRSVTVNVPGTKIMPHHLDVDVKVAGQEVSGRDIAQAMTHARGVASHGRDELLHVISSGFTVDGQKGISDARGMRGVHLGVHVTAFTALSSTLRNISMVAGHNQLEIDSFCAGAYASGLAALVDDERDLGCAVIDMGGGTTNISVFEGGKLIYVSAVPIGGQHVTSDIARGLTTSVADAERIKVLYGSALTSSIDDTAVIDVPPIGEEEHAQPNYVPKSLLAGIIQPRIEETFELVRARLVDSGVSQRTGRRVVLTGGASQLPGLCDIGQLILDRQIRLGRPQRIRGLAEATGGPAFATAAGLLHYAAEHADEIPVSQHGGVFSFPVPFSGQFLQKVTHWLKENW